MSEVQEKKRATSVQELHEKMMSMFMAAPPPTSKPYEPRSTDVIITPYGKCGTTWLQQTFHTLRTRGDMEFDDISRVVPWIETSPLLGLDLNAAQRAEPRGFKSHLSYTDVPKGAKYIVSIRDPKDALVSMYKFMEGWFMEPGAVTLDDFAQQNYMRGEQKTYWKHLISWWEVRNEPNVLMFSYEGMNKDREGTVRRVAEFCGIPLDDELLELTLKQTSFDFMLTHKSRFDDALMRTLSESVANLPAGSDSAKVREGKVGGHASLLSPAVIAELDEIWKDEIESRFGYASYDEMAKTL